MVGCAEEHDGVALLDERGELLLLLGHPAAGAVDDVEAPALRSVHDLRRHAVGADDDRCALLHVVELVDRDDALVAQLGVHALVVHDLAERVRGLALRPR